MNAGRYGPTLRTDVWTHAHCRAKSTRTHTLEISSLLYIVYIARSCLITAECLYICRCNLARFHRQQ